MKNLVLFLALFLCSKYSEAQTKIEPSSKITSAIIYEKGAMVTRTIDTKAINSNGIIIIDSLPQIINQKSIQAKCGNGLKIISIKNTVDHIRITNEVEKDSLNSLMIVVQDSIDYQITLLKSIKKEIDVIHKNDKFSTEDGTNMEQLAKASALYKTNLRSLNLEYLAITKKRDKYSSSLADLQRKFNVLRPETYNNIGVEIKVEFSSNVDKTMTLSYFTPNAAWYTFYDLRVQSAEKNSFLDHKAFVSQNTGEDWTDVKLTLSNRNPNKRISPPSINPYILQNIRHHGYSQNTSNHEFNSNNPNYLFGKVTDVNGETLIGASVYCKATNEGTVTDIDGSFKIRRSNNCVLTISYTGYQTQNFDASNLSYCNISLAEGMLLDEVVVTGMGVNADKDYSMKVKKFKKQEIRKAISVKPQQSLNVHSFEIIAPYSIPSNGEEYDVLLNSSSIPFAYQYLTYPSEEPTAYLSVGIPEWRTYDLFSGNVNLFLEGQYTGVSRLNIEENTDTLWFSLGEDIGVQVEKESVQEYNKKSFFKNKTIELHTFDLIVKNNKNKSVTIDIFDQVPISTDDDIKVKVLEISEAEFEEEKGFLTWKKTLVPGESKTYRVSYEIKYGKDVDIVSN